MTREDKQLLAVLEDNRCKRQFTSRRTGEWIKLGALLVHLKKQNPQMLPPLSGSYPLSQNTSGKKLVLFSLLALVISGLFRWCERYVWDNPLKQVRSRNDLNV